MLSSPLAALLVVPFLRPLSLARALSCLPVPFVPLLALWDGFVSNLRTYSPEELNELVAGIDVPNYRWQSGRTPGGLTRLPVTYLLGLPDPESPTDSVGGTVRAASPST